jgi:hypothetical protein
MEGSERFDEFVPAGLASLGIETDETELAVMRAAHRLYWPAMGALLALDLGAVETESAPDLSRQPREREA